MRLHFKRCANLPTALAKFSCTVIDDVVYVGGCGQSKVIYSYTEDKWSGLPACPVMCFGLGKLFGRVLTVGGIASKKVTADVHMFSKESREWVKGIPPMPTARCFPTVVSYESAIVACGGSGESGPTDKVEVFKNDCRQWFTKAPLPVPVVYLQSTIIGDTCYFLGGLSSSYCQWVCFTSMLSVTLEDLFDTTSPRFQEPGLWHTLLNPPTALSTSANLSGALVTIGGATGSNICNTVCAYSRNTQSWIELGSLTVNCICAGAASLQNGKVMLIGGLSGSEVRVAQETKSVLLVSLQSNSPNL